MKTRASSRRQDNAAQTNVRYGSHDIVVGAHAVHNHADIIKNKEGEDNGASPRDEKGEAGALAARDAEDKVDKRGADEGDEGDGEGASEEGEVLLADYRVERERGEDGERQEECLEDEVPEAGGGVLGADGAHEEALAEREGEEQLHVARVVVLVGHEAEEGAEGGDHGDDCEGARGGEDRVAHGRDEHEDGAHERREEELGAQDAEHLAQEAEAHGGRGCCDVRVAALDVEGLVHEFVGARMGGDGG